jgi:hypothetical protein
MSTTLESLQTTLAAEHAAVWVFSMLGAQTSESAEPELFAALTSSYTIHRSRRDQLARSIRDLGVEPMASSLAYEVPTTEGPNAAGTPEQVTAAARLVETRCAATYADLVGSTYGDQRSWAVDALADSAVRELGYRGSPEIFPGLSEFADR